MQKEIEEKFEKIDNRVTKIEGFLEKGQLRNGRLVKCDKCSYSWISRSEMGLVSCPKCGSKVKM